MLSYIPIIISGWLMGILVNYLADVLPIKRSLSKPLCDTCGSPFPLVNYLSWRRRCPSCGKKRSFRTWFIEIFFVITSTLLWIYPSIKLGFIPGLILLGYFAVIAIIDFEHRIILHPVVAFGIFLCWGGGVWLHGILRTLEGGLTGFGLMLLLYYLGILVVRMRLKKRVDLTEREAIGFGDVNLSGVLGLILGWPAILVGLFLTILSAGLVSFFYIMLMLAKHRYNPNLAIPYGPFLILGAAILLYLRF
jgi:prepilin signal peptidase PulO-like enzyme (type II secretory pathway)